MKGNGEPSRWHVTVGEGWDKERMCSVENGGGSGGAVGARKAHALFFVVFLIVPVLFTASLLLLLPWPSAFTPPPGIEMAQRCITINRYASV